MGEKDKKEDGESKHPWRNVAESGYALALTVAGAVFGPAAVAAFHAARVAKSVCGLLVKSLRRDGKGEPVKMESTVLEFDNRIDAVMIEYMDKLNRDEAYKGLALMLGKSMAGVVARMKAEGKSDAEIHAAMEKTVTAAIAEAKKDEAA